MNRSENGFGGRFEIDGQTVDRDVEGRGGNAEPRGFAETKEAVETSEADDARVRLQKALAHAGVASRRACESLITGGRVTVNGRVQRELGSRIESETDEVRVDGVVVQLDVSKRYFVLNKPRGVVSTMRDENGRPDLREFADRVDAGGPEDREAVDGPTGAATAAAHGAQGGVRLYNVGRLDTDTSGLLILTNDGALAHKLSHPSFGVRKTYVAKVRGRVTAAVIQRLKDGIELDDGSIRADSAKLLPGGPGAAHSLVEITLHSGRNRIVRRMLAEVGHPVVELVRRSFGPLHLGSQRMGELRELSAAERGALLSAAGGEQAGREGSPQKKRGSRGSVTAGRPGDGKGARGMRGVAAKGNPHKNKKGGGR